MSSSRPYHYRLVSTYHLYCMCVCVVVWECVRGECGSHHNSLSLMREPTENSSPLPPPPTPRLGPSSQCAFSSWVGWGGGGLMHSAQMWTCGEWQIAIHKYFPNMGSYKYVLPHLTLGSPPPPTLCLNHMHIAPLHITQLWSYVQFNNPFITR